MYYLCENGACKASVPDFSQLNLWQHRTMGAADFGGSFAPIAQYEKREIHTVFLAHKWIYMWVMNMKYALAIDIGTSSGRHIVGWMEDPSETVYN